MTIRIAHASISESNSVNGRKGDQTGKEVCIRNYYNFGYNVVLRVKDNGIRQRIIQNAIAGTNNNNIGYSQNDRNSLHNLLKANGYNFATVGPCNTDCSAFVTAVCIGAGVQALEYTGNAPTTSTMEKTFARTGMFEVLRDKNLMGNDRNIIEGDILLKPGSHVVIALDTGVDIGNFLASLANNNPVPTPQPAPTPQGQYVVGRSYTLQTNVNVRKAPSTSAAKVGHNGLTADGKKHDRDKNGSLDRGTVITCKEVRQVGNDTWLRCPSGWLCAVSGGEVLIK